MSLGIVKATANNIVSEREVRAIVKHAKRGEVTQKELQAIEQLYVHTSQRAYRAGQPAERLLRAFIVQHDPSFPGLLDKSFIEGLERRLVTDVGLAFPNDNPPAGIRFARVPLARGERSGRYEALLPVGPLAPGAKLRPPHEAEYVIFRRTDPSGRLIQFSHKITLAAPTLPSRPYEV